MMKIKNIIKKGFTVLLIALSCFFVLSSVCSAETSEAVSGSSGGGSGIIRGDQKITTAEAINYFCTISNLSSFDISRSFPDILSSDYGVKISNSAVSYYFWKDNTGNIHYRADDSDGSYLSCCDNAHVSTNLSDDSTTPGTLTGADLKAMAAEYNSRYCPMPTSDAFVWGYHSSTSIDQKGSSSAYDFYPDVPVYMDSRSWGGKAWLDFYVLPYYYDDNNSLGTFYGNYYFHIYAKNVNGSVTLYLDSYNLSDNILDRSFNSSWNVSNYPYLGFFGKNNVSIRGYTSNGNYYSRSGSALISMNCPSFTSIDGSVTGQIGTLIVSSTFTPDSNTNDDWGFLVQNTPFELFANQTQIDFNQIPDNYVITINGDTIYDYSITNPDTGDTTTINNYIINNYTIPASDDPTDPTDPTEPSDPTSPSITGNVTVSGNVDVSGKIDIDTKPIDINVNFNSGGSGGTTEAVDLSGYLDTLPEQSKTLTDYLEIFFSFLPPQLLAVLLAGIGAAVLCRVLGR